MSDKTTDENGLDELDPSDSESKPKEKKASTKGKTPEEDVGVGQASASVPKKEKVQKYSGSSDFGDIKVIFVSGGKSKKTAGMLEAMKESPLVTTVLPFDPLNPEMKSHTFKMNGLRFEVPVSEPVMVPQIVAQFIRQTIYSK